MPAHTSFPTLLSSSLIVPSCDFIVPSFNFIFFCFFKKCSTGIRRSDGSPFPFWFIPLPPRFFIVVCLCSPPGRRRRRPCRWWRRSPSTEQREPGWSLVFYLVVFLTLYLLWRVFIFVFFRWDLHLPTCHFLTDFQDNCVHFSHPFWTSVDLILNRFSWQYGFYFHHR